MAAIYAGARNVLVIDSELQSIDSKSLKPKETGLAVFCSPWMTRSWTLQERALGVDVYLRFKDGLVPLATLGVCAELAGSILAQGLWKWDVDRLESDSKTDIFSIWSNLRPSVED